ncbi:outer membrane protein assembly factor BamE [Oricola sp.]|uniref:outer membrane protein assembly factor BamE n=2 Tax=Oricola sp. TaxID=1979950 RepID=UPI0035152177
MVAPQKIKSRMRLASALPVLLASGTIALSGCTTPKVLSPSSFSPSETYKQGFVIDEETLQLVPPGSSREQVLLTLGTPTTKEVFDNEVFYYISQTRRRPVAFMKPKLIDQRILAVYFTEDGTVDRIANYGMQDGRVFDFITRTTPTRGKDETFLAQILSGGLMPTAESALKR